LGNALIALHNQLRDITVFLATDHPVSYERFELANESETGSFGIAIETTWLRQVANGPGRERRHQERIAIAIEFDVTKLKSVSGSLPFAPNALPSPTVKRYQIAGLSFYQRLGVHIAQH
jgi:hypothetical protein